MNKNPETIEKLKEKGVKDKDLVISDREIKFNPEYQDGSIRCFTLPVKKKKEEERD